MADNIETISYINLGDGLEHPIVDLNAFDNVEYNSQTKRINFKHGDTVLKYIDATDFIKDGMVNDVQITTPESGDNAGQVCLLVTFNTDAGKDDIELPLTSIFNPNNYYTKTQIDQSVVKYSTAQNLNDAHKSQARQNIGAGTLTGVTFNGSAASVSNGVATINESDPVFSASVAASISASDITNWNSKTSNTGTLTGVTFNGTSASVSNGIASISVAIPAEVTETTITGWGFTKNSGTLTSETDPIFSASVAASISASDIANWNSKTSNIGTLTGVTFNGVSASVSNGVVSISANVLPSVSASDNGKYLKVSNGQWDLATPLTVYSGSGTPSNSLGNDGDIYLQQ